MSNRRKERERRRRIAHAPALPRDEGAVKPERAPKAERMASTKKGRSTASGRKPVPEPSLQRSLRRGAIVLVALFALIYIVDHGKHPLGTDLIQALLGAALFIPFDYLLTRLVYTRINKRFGS